SIGYRVWTLRDVKLYSGTSLVNVLTTIESADLGTAWTTFFLISYQANSSLHFTAVDTWSELSGISFMLINAQTGSRIQYDSRAGSNRTTNRTDKSSGGSYQMRPLAVKITSVVDHDDALEAKCAESHGGSFIPSSQ
ncbi:uncharacterized protein C8Q71DRAFT_743106, partial [Rhodofomes roseus]